MSATLISIPQSANNYVVAPVINRNDERQVDIRLEHNSDVTLYGWLAPGESPGDEIVVRLLPLPSQFESSTNTANRTTFKLRALSETLNLAETSPAKPFQWNAQQYQELTFLPFNPLGVVGAHIPTPPTMVILRWTGTQWLVVAATDGVTA
ncbi:hypothetical protein HOU00_gp479 [Caulobacter phage CcrPW]|uniref:Uncharacterized protein n=1 Tax=Caulobacter phage CcrPW TaxID=2283271 RepID=A0A385EA87_9CAUD|nr:hypothetical protein HOU00_gp479 [Caulobacter phage CcrPW]AXQ68646.1 hypothetical protein CcrPW_gp107c [Caulobacter phage CcrPW]